MHFPALAKGLLVLLSISATASAAAIEARDDPINTDVGNQSDSARHPACWRKQRDIGASCHNGGSGGEIFGGVNDNCKGYAVSYLLLLTTCYEFCYGENLLTWFFFFTQKCVVSGAPSYFCPITRDNVANCNACVQGGGSRPCPTV